MRIWREGTYRPHGYKKCDKVWFCQTCSSCTAHHKHCEDSTSSSFLCPATREHRGPSRPIEALLSTYHYKPHFCLHLTLSSKSPYSQALTLISSAPLRGVAAYCLQDAVRSRRVPGHQAVSHSAEQAIKSHGFKTEERQEHRQQMGQEWGKES